MKTELDLGTYKIIDAKLISKEYGPSVLFGYDHDEIWEVTAKHKTTGEIIKTKIARWIKENNDEQ